MLGFARTAAARVTLAGFALALAPLAAAGGSIHDRAELEAFVDGAMTALVNDRHIAGVTVAVVQDGQVMLTKGYGFADVARRTPVDPQASMFRIGSISKVFTWTAVMQLVEQGKLDLDRDVNDYLDWKIPATFPQPITMRHLLTHTPGMEEDARDWFTGDSLRVTAMGPWLRDHMPRRVMPPGTYAAYSNWGAALAGHVVERVSGVSWSDYIEQRILTPLAMTHTTVREPVPAALAADVALGYEVEDGQFEPAKTVYVTAALPAGSVRSTAADMSRFMLAHLGGGALDGVRILQDSTERRMQSRRFGHDPRLPGMAHGFYQDWSHGQHMLRHAGDIATFHSDLLLIPDARLGLFVSTSSGDLGRAGFRPFVTAFLDHYFPVAAPSQAAPSNDRAAARRFAGDYLFNRRNHSTFQKSFALDEYVSIRANDDGSLALKWPFGPVRLVRVDSTLYRDDQSGSLVAFQLDDKGRVARAFAGMLPPMALDRQSLLGSPRLHLWILCLGLVTFALVVVVAIVRRFGRGPGRPAPLVAAGRRVMVVVALLQLAFLVGALVFADSIDLASFRGATAGFAVTLALPVVGLGLALVAAWLGVRQWANGVGTFGARLRHSLAVVMALLFFWSLHCWNLLGWRL